MGVTVTGLEEARQMLVEHRERAESLEPFLMAEAQALVALIDESWATRTSPDGTPWRPEGINAEGGERLMVAHTVTVDEGAMVLSVPHVAARYQFYGTKTIPARNPTPFDRNGVPSPAWAEGYAARLKAYLLVGAEGQIGGVHGR